MIILLLLHNHLGYYYIIDRYHLHDFARTVSLLFIPSVPLFSLPTLFFSLLSPSPPPPQAVIMPGSHTHFRGGFENLFKDISGLVQSCGDYMLQVGLVELLCRLLPASEFARQDFAATFLPGNEAANVRIGTVKD